MRHVDVPAERLERWLAGFAERHGPVQVGVSAEQVTLLGADGDRAVLEVPFPPLTGDDLPAVVEHVLRPRRVGVLLVRRGGHAAGLFDGTRLVASKVGSGYVQSTTKAGGWSQHRYANRRANQTRAAWEQAADAAVRVLGGRELDALVVGGDRPGIDAVLADARLAPLRTLVREPWLAVPDPRLRVLEATPVRFRGVRIALEP